MLRYLLCFCTVHTALGLSFEIWLSPSMLSKVIPLPYPLSQPASQPLWVLSNPGTRVCLFSLPTAGSRSSSPGKLLGHSSYGRIPRATASASSTPADKRSRIPRSQGCSRETSPSRLGLGKASAPARTSRALPLKTSCCRSAGLLSVFFLNKCPKWRMLIV